MSLKPQLKIPEFRLDGDHRYWLGSQQIEGVTYVLDENGLVSDFCKKPEYAERGHLVHRAAALFGMGTLEWSTVDVRILGHVLSAVKFYEALNVKPVVLEVPDFHPDYLYGYTFDGIGSSSMGDILWDFKSGKATKIGTALQTAAYLDPVQKKYGGRWKRVAVELDPDGGTPNLRWYADRSDWPNFLSCLNCTRLRKMA
jgi:hypothetical protein